MREGMSASYTDFLFEFFFHHKPSTSESGYNITVLFNELISVAAYRLVQTLRFLYIPLPPWDRLALQFQ